MVQQERQAETMKLRDLKIDELFDTSGNMFIQCSRKHGPTATPGPHAFLYAQGIPVAEHQKHLDTVNKTGWQIDDTDSSYYCPHCVAALNP